jgi:thiosulfate reductase/polysulfide reductase chain A
MKILDAKISRRRFLQATGATGAAGMAGAGFHTLQAGPVGEAQAAAADASYKITKNICHQCPARCGIDVYTANGKVHAIYGTTDHPIANGKLCPKGSLGAYILYDPDRFKGPMKRTNPKKGRDEDPKFVPISWDEALKTVADRLNALRDKGESHRFALLYGRGWGASCAGLQGTFGKLYGSPNVAIGHASLCAEGSKRAKAATDGNDSYNAYDYENTNYLLNFGAGFLEAFRPYNYLMQAWGKMRTKSPRTRVTAVDVHFTTTASAADRFLNVKPATDGALALAIAHVILTEGLWDRAFVGDFADGVNKFKAGETIDPASFKQKWVHGLPEWWNAELKDRTPKWAAEVTTVPEKDIMAVAREFSTTRPAMAIMERGPTGHFNGTYNGMAIHSLNALVGSLFAKGGMMYQMGPAYGPMPVKAEDYMDDYAKSDDRKKPRIDMAKSEEWPMTGTMMQEVAKNHLAGKPYKLDTMMFYLTNPIWTAPQNRQWEEALKDVFIIETSPFPSETSVYADLILPDHTYLERLQDAPTYPFKGYPLAQLRVPAVKPLYDTKYYGDTLIEIGKRIKGPTGEYYKALGNTENVIRHLAKGFADKPGDNGVDSFEKWVEKGVWYKKPYLWQQRNGEFYEWDGQAYSKLMTPEQVKEKLLKTASGKFEFKSSFLEKHAAYINKKMGIAEDRVGYPQWVAPRYSSEGELHLITPKLALHAEGRSANIPQVIGMIQPAVGGRNTVYLEINPATAKAKGIADGDRVRLKNALGSIEAVAKLSEATRPDCVRLPMENGHWAWGRWAKGRGPGHSGEITPNQSDPISGLASYYTAKVTVERA